jgi:Outer membrane protein beta-barrel domain
MHRLWGTFRSLVLVFAFSVWGTSALAQAPDENRFSFDVGMGIDVSVNGNVNSGAIGRLDGQATAILPSPYGQVYGTGLHFLLGGGYALNAESELRGTFTFQSADADLVRLGDIGPSSLYGQYSDYQTFGLDVGYRRYLGLSNTRARVYAEATIGIAFIDAIDVVLAAPQSNIVLDNTDFYDQTGAFTWGIGGGVLFPITERMQVNTQIGLRRVSGLAEVDQFVGTGLDEINNDSARLTFPIVVGLRILF